jgi:hypothetical protein
MSGAFQTRCIEICPHSAQSRAMNTSWKTLLIAALSTVCTAAAQENRSLTAVIYDYAGLSDSSINELESLSAVLLSRVGIRIEWVHCLGHSQGPRPALCDANLETGTVLLRILATHQGTASNLGDPLGASVVAGGYASIYVSEIRKYAEHNGLPAGTLMAYAATHEIGHLLLGEKHSSSGIMRAVWGKTEYRDMAQRWLGFSAAQGQALLRTIPAPAPILTETK